MEEQVSAIESSGGADRSTPVAARWAVAPMPSDGLRSSLSDAQVVQRRVASQAAAVKRTAAATERSAADREAAKRRYADRRNEQKRVRRATLSFVPPPVAAPPINDDELGLQPLEAFDPGTTVPSLPHPPTAPSLLLSPLP